VKRIGIDVAVGQTNAPDAESVLRKTGYIRRVLID